MSWSYRAHATPASGTGTTSALPTCSTCSRSPPSPAGCPLPLSLFLLPRAPLRASSFCLPYPPLSCPWPEPSAGLAPAAGLAQGLTSSDTAFPLLPYGTAVCQVCAALGMEINILSPAFSAFVFSLYGPGFHFRYGSVGWFTLSLGPVTLCHSGKGYPANKVGSLG